MTGSAALNVPVVCADRFSLSGEAQDELCRLGGFAWADAADAGDLARKIGGSPEVRVIVTEYVPVNDEVLDMAPGLKGVIAYGAGYNHIDAEALGRRGVQVCNCPGENSQAVAELVFGLLLCLLRRIGKADPWVRSGGWARAGLALPGWATGGELCGKTLGIIGMGNIGARVARIAHGFGMEVMGFDPCLGQGRMQELGVEPSTLGKIMSRADMVTLHVPLVPDTKGLIGEAELAGARPGLILVNTSRGRVIQEEALIHALESGLIEGAALDVFADEPLLPSHPLARMDKVILTPHLGALTREAGHRLSRSVARQARDILEGRTPEGRVRPR